MQFKTITHQKLPFYVALSLMAVLTSCGSFQYSGYDNDGIYATDADNDIVVEQPEVITSSSDSNYYKNYFSDNAAEVDAIQEESEIFTNIDSYAGNYLEQAQDTLEQRPIYGGWGQSNNVTINVIDNGWGYDGWGFSSFGGWGYGWGYPGYGWGYPGYGWGYPGYGWGYPGYGWCYPGYGWGYPGYGYNGYNSYSYSNGRRGSTLYNNDLSRIGRSNSAISRRDYSTRRLSSSIASTTRNIRGTSIGSNSTRRNTGTTRVTRPTRSISNSTPTRTTRSTRITRPSTTRSTRTNRSSAPSRTTRSISPTRSTRSSSGNVRSSGSSRSSGSIRSSGGSSSRSSGSRSSGGSRRGRG